MIVSREEGFTLVELMIVILIIAILVAIAIPVYMSLQNKASHTRAMANLRIASGAMESVYLNDILDKGYPPGYVKNAAGDPIDADFLLSKEPKIKWVDFDLDTNNWPTFESLGEELKTGVAVVHLLGEGTDTIIIASLSKDGHCWFDQYYSDQRPESGDFNWADGPPGG